MRAILDSLLVVVSAVLVAGVASGIAQAHPSDGAGSSTEAQTSMSVPSESAGHGGVATLPSGAGPDSWHAVGASASSSQSLDQQIGVSVGPGPSTSPPPAPGGSASVQQTITVAVRSGGPLRVTPDRVTVVLHRQGSLLVGTLGPVELTDPRGSLAGWELRAAPVTQDVGHHRGEARDERGGIMVQPAGPVAVTGRPSEVSRAHPAWVGDDGALLMSARPGGGGGAFSVSAQIVVVDARRTAGASLTFVITAS